MSSKEFLIDFVNYLFMILIVAGAIFFVYQPGYFTAFMHLIPLLIPFAFFALVFLLKAKFERSRLKAKTEAGELDMVVYLTYLDKMRAELILFGLPSIMLALVIVFSDVVDTAHVLEAMVAFIIFYFWKNSIFSKAR